MGYHFVRERVTRRALEIRFISTHDQLADVLKKPLAATLFEKFRNNLTRDSHDEIEERC
jgi:hypothetical protein